MASKLTEDSVS